MNLQEFQEFEQSTKNDIPPGEFGQCSIEKAKDLGIDIYESDSLHDISIIDETGNRTVFGQFTHAHYADYVKTILNAYRNGDLVHKDSL